MNLAIDIGNTSIKAGLFEGDELILLERFANLDQLKAFVIQKGSLPTAICSVKYSFDQLIDAIPKLQNAIFLTCKTETPLNIDYKTPQTLGMDRLAAAIGGYELYKGKRALIIDLGTCITYDLLEEATYKGGVIAPGLKMRFKAMNEFTANLPLVEVFETEEIIGKSTIESMNSGVLNGIVGEIEHYISQLLLKNADLEVIITGGDAHLFESKIKSDIFVAPEIVLLGLNGVLKKNA